MLSDDIFPNHAVFIDWRRYVFSVTVWTGWAALFGYLCLQDNEFQLEYQSQWHTHTHTHTHYHTELLSDSASLIWVYLFLKKANSAGMCTVLQRNSLHFNTLFFFHSSERMFHFLYTSTAHYISHLSFILFCFVPYFHLNDVDIHNSIFYNPSLFVSGLGLALIPHLLVCFL